MSAIGPLTAQPYLPAPSISSSSAAKVDRDGDGDHNAPDIKPSANRSSSGLLNSVA